jgi:DNA-directed RNA polymerase subunit D
MTMKVNVISLTEDTVRFIIEGVDTPFINALRRTLISEVPCMVIDDLFIFDNSSVIPDEQLANRIGLVPLKTDLDNYIRPEKCDCGSDLGCEKCRTVLTLDVESTDEVVTVTSGDLESADPNVVPVSPGIPLTKLAPGQAVRLEAYARLGEGKTHAKWQPVSSAVYQHVSELEIDEKTCTACGKCAESCPSGVLEIQDGKLKIVDVNACTLCGECTKACPVEPAAINQGMKPDAFIMTVESTGCMPPEKLVQEAVKILKAKLSEFSTKIETDDVHDEITMFEAPEQANNKLYSVGTIEPEEEDEGTEEE